MTLDDDVVRLLDDAVHAQRRPMKQVVNDALRRALTPERDPHDPYVLQPHESAIKPGFDPSGFNRLADELADDEIARGGRGAK